MEDDIKFVVRKSSGAVLEPEVAWKHHYDPIGQNIIKLRKCVSSLPKIRSKKGKEKKSEREVPKNNAEWQKENESLLRIQNISQLPELPDYPKSFPSNGNVLIKKKKLRCKIKMAGILSENVVKKQRLLFVKRILAQTGFKVEDMDSGSLELNCLADVADEFFKRFVAAMQLHRSNRFHPLTESENLLHLVETTLKKSGLGGISGLQRYYHQVIKKHDILYRKCQKLIDSYKACLPQQMNNGSMIPSSEVQSHQNIVQAALGQSSAVSSISPNNIKKQTGVYPQDRTVTSEVQSHQNIVQAALAQSSAASSISPNNIYKQTSVYPQDRILTSEVQSHQHVVQATLVQSSAVSSISPNNIYQQTGVYPQDRILSSEVQSHQHIVQASLAQSSAVSSISTIDIYQQTEVYLQDRVFSAEVQSHQHIVQAALGQSSAVSAIISPDREGEYLYQQTGVYSQDRVFSAEVQSHQHIVQAALGQSSAVSSIISPGSIYQQTGVYHQDSEYCLDINSEDSDSDQSVVEINCYPPPNAQSATLVSSLDYQQISEDSSDDHEKSSTSCEQLTQGIHAPPHSSLHESTACSKQKKSSRSIKKVSFSPTTQKHYLCDYCERNYASMSSLNRHLSNDHNIPPPKKKRKT